MLNICYFNCFQEPHTRIGEPLAKLVFLRPKERKWEDWRQQKVVLHGMKSIFFPRMNCVVIFVYSLKSRNLEITMYPNTNFNPRSPSGKIPAYCVRNKFLKLCVSWLKNVKINREAKWIHQTKFTLKWVYCENWCLTKWGSMKAWKLWWGFSIGIHRKNSG